ncbi:MAG TPA: cation-translocating P-type ATPase [Candidatus Limnocylindria bacterium]|jgi:Ca2+-transporting ATPase
MTDWHQLAVADALRQLGTDPDAGLSSAQAAQRLTEHGPNELQADDTVSPWAIFAAQFKNVLIIILLIAVGLSAVLGHALEAVVIGIIVVFAVLLGFIQEFRAERAIQALRHMAAPTASVLRDGVEVELPARDIVPGDVVRLSAGDRVPADARLVEAINLQVDEAPLTGESIPVEKHTDALTDARLPVGDRRNMVYGGTAGTYGRGRGVVVATGMSTEFGQIARMLQTVETGRTPLQVNLDRVGRALAIGALAIVGMIILLGLLRGQPLLDMLIFGIALAVAVVPEALPAVVTISLAIGVQRMVRRHALIRKLTAVEALGSVSIICSDKTGTLTKDEMTARRVLVAGDVLDVSGAGYEPHGDFLRAGSRVEPSRQLIDLLRAGALASDARITEVDGRWEVKGDPTEGALVVAAAKAGLDKSALDSQFPRVQEIPFTAETKRMTTLHAIGDGTVAYSKGAPEIVLDSCSTMLGESGEEPLDEAGRATLRQAAQAMASDALRVLAVARKPGADLESADSDMTFLGLIGMIDPPRPEAADAVQTCREAGIKPVMITGDHPLTARAVASELGILTNGRVISGQELDEMAPADLARDLDDIEVFARVSPANKLQVVTGLQEAGHLVAMTGDGVNDAPALKKADIGVAMGITGTDVSKEAAAMTLTDDNFASIVAAVEEGRGVFGNIKKYLMYLLSSNVGEMLLMVGATLAGLPLPLTAVQILYVNLVTDGLPALALAVDPPESDLMRRPPRNPRRGIFTRPVVALITAGGLWSTVVNLSLFVWALGSGRTLAQAMTLTFLSLVLIQFFKAYNFRSERHSVARRPFANRWLNLSIGFEVLLLPLIMYVPFLSDAFGIAPLGPSDWVLTLVLAATVVPILELVKWMVRREWFGPLD